MGGQNFSILYSNRLQLRGFIFVLYIWLLCLFSLNIKVQVMTSHISYNIPDPTDWKISYKQSSVTCILPIYFDLYKAINRVVYAKVYTRKDSAVFLCLCRYIPDDYLIEVETCMRGTCEKLLFIIDLAVCLIKCCIISVLHEMYGLR